MTLTGDSENTATHQKNTDCDSPGVDSSPVFASVECVFERSKCIFDKVISHFEMWRRPPSTLCITWPIITSYDSALSNKCYPL